MTSPAELHRLIEESIRDPRREPEFLRALLEAKLFVHLPWSDDNPKLRLVCFTRPDGVTVIPMFSDRGKAERAAQGAVRIGVVGARELFASAPGATFMLDPNDTTTTLYPEEVDALLRGDPPPIAPVAASVSDTALSPPNPDDEWLGDLIGRALGAIGEVKAVHLALGHVAGARDPTTFLVIVAVDEKHAERVARAVAVALQASPRTLRLPVDLTVYAPMSTPDWMPEGGFPCYLPRRSAEVH